MEEQPDNTNEPAVPLTPNQLDLAEQHSTYLDDELEGIPTNEHVAVLEQELASIAQELTTIISELPSQQSSPKPQG